MVAVALFSASCGGDGERTSNLRPPSPVNLAVVIQDDEVTVSPRKIGAGPLTVLASNQSSASHRLTIDGPQLRQSLGPINPQDTATLKITVRSGSYTLSADDASGPEPGRLVVGPKRPSSQNELQLP